MAAQERSSVERESDYEIYRAVRAHELELNRATAAFEHAALGPLFLLNGGAVVAFLTLLGALLDGGGGLEPRLPLAIAAAFAWGVGLMAAARAAHFGWRSQRSFSMAERLRRESIEKELGASPAVLDATVATRSGERQGQPDAADVSAAPAGDGSAGTADAGRSTASAGDSKHDEPRGDPSSEDSPTRRRGRRVRGWPRRLVGGRSDDPKTAKQAENVAREIQGNFVTWQMVSAGAFIIGLLLAGATLVLAESAGATQSASEDASGAAEPGGGPQAPDAVTPTPGRGDDGATTPPVDPGEDGTAAPEGGSRDDAPTVRELAGAVLPGLLGVVEGALALADDAAEAGRLVARLGEAAATSAVETLASELSTFAVDTLRDLAGGDAEMSEELRDELAEAVEKALEDVSPNGSTQQIEASLQSVIDRIIERWEAAAAAELAVRDGDPSGVTRLDGPTRYETAVAVSQRAYPSGADVVYVATGERFPDALAGGAALTRLGGPLLFVARTEIPDATRAEVRRLAPRSIVVIGGREAVAPSVAGELADLVDGRRAAVNP